ncbi:phage recombination protein Bet [Solibacillus sp. FSL H8-0523]|uniref:phage recombination protein Bet n=1 Tax=Solibacillus sp. FSL H8-0523 TaxID=2954511 RepID=UPI003101B22D
MSNAVVNQPPKQQYEVSFEVNGEQLHLDEMTVVNYLLNGDIDKVTPPEVVMFLNLCKYQKLNPFLKEAYLIKYGTKPAQIIVSKEAFMKRAENHPKYLGFEAGVIVERDGQLVEIEGAVKLKNDILIGGWCKVYREDRKMPITSKISLSEFSKGQSTWNSMPLTMIRKSAIVNGLREAFPDTLGAMYTEDDADINQMQGNAVQNEIDQNANMEELDIKPTKKKIEPVTHVQDAQVIEGYEQQELISDKEELGF